LGIGGACILSIISFNRFINKFVRSLKQEIRFRLNAWTVAALLVGLVIFIPVSEVFWHIGQSTENWAHLKDTVLGKYLKGTLILVLGTVTLSVLVGVLCAWLVACCEFPGRRFFEWALILPLAIPTFIAAYAYFDLLDKLIPVRIWVRENISPDAMISLNEALPYIVTILVLASVLYPYVYLVARAAFTRQGNQYVEASQTLGHSPKSIFWRVALPLARPAIVAGASLVVMETLNDYGAVQHFNVPSFTTGIFRTWLSLNDMAGALRLASFLMLFILIILLLEKLLRSGARYHGDKKSTIPFRRYPLGKVKSLLAILCCLPPLVFGFLYPVWRLGVWAHETLGQKTFDQTDYLKLALNSMGLAIVASLVTVLIALLLVFAARYFKSHAVHFSNRLAILGYSVPGAVIAMGILHLNGKINSALDIVVTGSLLTLVAAYIIRFLAVAWQSLDSGMERNCGQFNEASKSLGASAFTSLFRVNVPLLRNALFVAGLLVFVDIMKELPLTLILRPFNFETLSTRTFDLAFQSKIPESSVPALCIILAVIVPVVWLNRKIETGK